MKTTHTTKQPPQRQIPNEVAPAQNEEQKYNLVFWLAITGFPGECYRTVDKSQEECVQFAEFLETRADHEFCNFPMKSLEGRMVGYRREQIVAYTIERAT